MPQARVRPEKALRFSYVQCMNWKNFVRIEAELQRRVFLVGPNASGKSNFLDIFRFLRDVVSVGGGFQAAVNSRGGVSHIRALAARSNPDIAIKVNIGTEAEQSLWTYEIIFHQDNQRKPIIRKERVFQKGRLILDRPLDEDLDDTERLRQTYLEQVNANRDFRDIAEFFLSTRYLHIVPQLVREPDRSSGRKNDPFGGDFLEQIAGTPKKTQESRLKRINAALKVAVPQLTELKLQRDEKGVPHLHGRYDHWRPHGAWQTEEQFSDGTLRLLGFLWACLEGNGPLLLEEPELSIHPEVIRYFPQMLARIQRQSGRQTIISTHSSDILRDEGIGLDEVLLLVPSKEGTRTVQASSVREIKLLLDGGLTLADTAIPYTKPDNAEQLAFFS